ncbi:autotransporter outer membrane beta-barrel domain-containing protein, partial [Salmonella enterica subsp. enterica]|nr:autotransporter outer membrane beta-barrel domain-containing protein [Salmonella enterica subsp. enterica serovar Aqua]
MAVENKFKINFIAASVLMGLSLSAMTSAVASENQAAEAAPAPKTLAEAAGSIKAANVAFVQGEEVANPSKASHLSDLLDYLGKLDTSHDKASTSVSYARKELVSAYQNAKTEETKTTALQNLVAFDRETAVSMVKLGTSVLNDALQEKKGDISGAKENISKELEGLHDADAKAKAAYEKAIATFLAGKQDDPAQTVLKTELTKVGGPLVSDAEIKDILAGNNIKGGFKTYDELVSDASAKLASHAELLKQQGNLKDALKPVTEARKNLASDMKTLANSMPFFTPEEQKNAGGTYLTALKAIGKQATDADTQSKAPDAGQVTHILGSLTADEYENEKPDPLTGEYKSVIINVDKAGNVTAKDNFTANDLYTGTKDKPFTTTVLDIRALELGNGKLADTNTITVGEAGTKDKKATPVEVWAKTAGAKHQGDNDSRPYISAEHGPAVKLSGDLRTATTQVDESGKPMEGQIVRGADQIHLQNVNIHNSFTLADKVQMLTDDVAALNQQAADKLKLGQPAKSDDVNHIEGVNDWLRKQNDLLNGKYDNLQLTGLQIDTKTVNPEFNLTDNINNPIGEFVNTQATVAPADANILLDNLNITLQNDSVGGTSTAINLSGTGNHILANRGVFDAGKADNLTQANVLDITGKNNTVDFTGSTLKGDIRSSAEGNKVNLTNGSLTGNAVSATGNLTLNLDGSTWTGWAGTNSPDVSLSNNSIWNVVGNSSTNSLTLNGSNTLNLVNAEGQAQLGGRGFAGVKSAVTLNVDTDLKSDGKGVTSVQAGTYSPDNLHGLTNTGRADGYQFGTLKVDGLATGGKYALSVESAGAEPYTVGGRLADGPGATSAHEFVSYKTAESRPDDTNPSALKPESSTADFTSLSAPAELGVYQYAAEKVMDGVNNRTNIYYSSTGKLSNSAATVVSLAAAPVDVANLESDTLAKHMNSVRHGKDSGVWVSYFGGENRNTTAAGPEYTLKTNGVMLGADTLTENNWLAGVAVSSARSDMSVMNSSGDLNSYGAQFYMSRRYDSGVFVDSALQFNHFSNTAKARMTDGQQAKADFSGNSYGLEA